MKLQVNKWDLVTCAYRGIGQRITLGLSNDPTGRFFAAQDYKVLGL